MTHSDWPSIFIGLYVFDGKHSKLRAVFSLCVTALFNSSYKYLFFMDVDESINNDESHASNETITGH